MKRKERKRRLEAFVDPPPLKWLTSSQSDLHVSRSKDKKVTPTSTPKGKSGIPHPTKLYAHAPPQSLTHDSIKQLVETSMDAKMDLILKAINAKQGVSHVQATPVKKKPLVHSLKSISLPPSTPVAQKGKPKPDVTVSLAKSVLRYPTYSTDDEEGGEEDAEWPKNTGNPSYESSSNLASDFNTSSDTVKDFPGVVDSIPIGDGGHVDIQINASQDDFIDSSDCFDDVHSEQEFTAEEEMPSSADETGYDPATVQDKDKLLREDVNQSWKDVIMEVSNRNNFVLPLVESEPRMAGESPARENRLFQ